MGGFSSCLQALQGAGAERGMPGCVPGMGPWWVTASGTRRGSVGVSGTQEYVSEPRGLLGSPWAAGRVQVLTQGLAYRRYPAHKKQLKHSK